jgi:hypothetical protein
MTGLDVAAERAAKVELDGLFPACAIRIFDRWLSEKIRPFIAIDLFVFDASD